VVQEKMQRAGLLPVPREVSTPTRLNRKGAVTVLPATQQETDAVREYFEWQAPNLEITFMQKVYSESVVSTRHDVWDIHTKKDRWWVITNPTNLYSQEQFPNMDLVVTFHIGLCIRIPRTQQQLVDDRRVVPFGTAFGKLDEAIGALSQAHNLAGDQGIGARARETLLELIAAAQDSAEWTDEPPKRADFRGWTGVLGNELLPGDSNKERRSLFKNAMESAWTFANWLTHAKSATWQDADLAIASVQHALQMATSFIIRELRGVPEVCPACGSPNLEPEDGENRATPGVLWQRPVCADCGWIGRPIPIATTEDSEGLVTREGHDGDDAHSIMVNPLRSIRKPSDDK
jgi:hypothetical protein